MNDETPDAKLARAFRQMTAGLELAMEAIVERGVAASEWVGQDDSPLGKSAHLALARSGKVESRKVHRKVLIRRTDLNRYIETKAEARGVANDHDDVSDVLDRITGSVGK